MNRRLNAWIAEGFLFLFCLPTSNQIFAPISILIKCGQYLGLVWSIIVFLKLRIFKEKVLWPVWIFVAIMIFSTLVNRTDISACVNMVFPIVASCILTFHIIKLKGFKGVEIIAKVFSVLLIVQAVSAIAGGFGTYTDGNNIVIVNYFFMDRVNFNRIFIYAISLLVLAFIYGRKWRWLYVTGGICGVFFVFYESVSTAIMTAIVFFLVLIVARIVKSAHVWRNMLILLFIMAALFVIVGFSPERFEWLLVDFLQEDMTLDGRTLLWAQAIENMQGWHWIIGNGYGHKFLFWIGTWAVGTAHSQYMNILFCFGLIGISIYFFMICQFFRGLKGEKDENYKRLVVATVAAIIITGIPTTTYTSVYLYVIYTVFTFPGLRSELKYVVSKGKALRKDIE